ncbi:pilus assembly protein [Pseudoglutamicibacter cumminsii]|uniref:pilus assembly protein n=1 Tax=Pseudoglutamicibacter cumminsii TaxID=156979 RepID=UPI0025559A4E|nr:pilus assembly protein [Pseudoglutamicibacter cumminsii]MDK7083639.1 pilus assembly protein [Pseudoglutamicibacter cumminsii]
MHSTQIQATSRGPATLEMLKPCAKTEPERGSAIVEFIGLSVLLAIPLMYLMLAISMVQASNLAAVAAADQAARIVSHSNATPDTGAPGTREKAEHAIADVMNGYGIAADNASLSVECSGPCPGPGSLITARVEVRVPLPFVPEGVQGIVKTHSETTMLVGETE